MSRMKLKLSLSYSVALTVAEMLNRSSLYPSGAHARPTASVAIGIGPIIDEKRLAKMLREACQDEVLGMAKIPWRPKAA
jgi:hypothetical protein